MDSEIKDKIPAGAAEILERLRDAGYEAYVVGGCVRDCLLGRTPADWDITTSARPQQIKELFKHTVDTGIKHGTVTVLHRHKGVITPYEVTTYRIDGEYEDGRHPKQVSFTSELSEDLRRRDFTINAMAYAPGEGLVDLYGGVKDLEDKVIRCVGDPEERFSEDALRMMRAIRFSAQLGAEIEKTTWKAVCKMADNIAMVSAERIRVELEKLILSPEPGRFRLFYESGLTRHFLPEWEGCVNTTQENPHHCYNVSDHLLKAVESVDRRETAEDYPEDTERVFRLLRLTMLLHDIAKPLTKTVDEDGIAHFKGHPELGAQMAEEILRRLKYDNDTIRGVSHLIYHHEERFPADRRSVRRALNRIGEEYFPMFFHIQRADMRAQSTFMRKDKEQRLKELRELWEQTLADRHCVSLKTLAVKGADLMAAGMKPGPEIGRTLGRMLEDVLDEPSHNDKEYLLKRYLP
ncbi:MAG: HD domain-containing protein [Lachnospiraceae bacterium]|nr:HD domain-containing protein [Lachnospiraceae bacterium]